MVYLGNLSETNFKKNIRFMIYKFWNFLKFLKYVWKISNFYFNLYIFFWNFIKILKFWTFLKILKFYYPPTHSIYWTPYPWYFDSPTHGILTPLPMVYWPPYPWYIDPLNSSWGLQQYFIYTQKKYIKKPPPNILYLNHKIGLKL